MISLKYRGWNCGFHNSVVYFFLDNAIEASLDSSAKKVNIALISGETKVVIVENTIAQESINTVRYL